MRVATGDVTGDGVPDIVTAPGVGGGPVVRIFDGVTGNMVREFNAYDANFRGGVYIALADLDGDGKDDIITGAGAGGGPHVKVFNGATLHTDFSFMAYDPGFTGGVTVAGFSASRGANNTLFAGEVVTGAGPGGGPHVKAFTMTPGASNPTVAASFLAYDPAFHGGVNVAAHGTVGATGLANLQIVTAPQKGGGPDVRIYNFAGQQLAAFFAIRFQFLRRRIGRGAAPRFQRRQHDRDRRRLWRRPPRRMVDAQWRECVAAKELLRLRSRLHRGDLCGLMI